MSLKIITHINPDLDAIGSVWLLRRFDQEFENAEVDFVPAGQTYKGEKVDSDPEIVHVDTGMGRFDHHQFRAKTCAAEVIFNYLKLKYDYLEEDEALARLVKIIVEVDNFEECYYPDATNDRYDFSLSSVLSGLKSNNTVGDKGLVDLGCTCLDGVYTSLRIKVEALTEMKTSVQEFESKWGKSFVISSHNDNVLTMGQMAGYVLVIRKDPEKGMVRIKAQPHSDVELGEFYDLIKQRDPDGSWFLHSSGKMLLNGSYKNPNTVPSKLTTDDLIEIFKKK